MVTLSRKQIIEIEALGPVLPSYESGHFCVYVETKLMAVL